MKLVKIETPNGGYFYAQQLCGGEYCVVVAGKNGFGTFKRCAHKARSTGVLLESIKGAEGTERCLLVPTAARGLQLVVANLTSDDDSSLRRDLARTLRHIADMVEDDDTTPANNYVSKCGASAYFKWLGMRPINPAQSEASGTDWSVELPRQIETGDPGEFISEEEEATLVAAAKKAGEYLFDEQGK